MCFVFCVRRQGSQPCLPNTAWVDFLVIFPSAKGEYGCRTPCSLCFLSYGLVFYKLSSTKILIRDTSLSLLMRMVVVVSLWYDMLMTLFFSWRLQKENLFASRLCWTLLHNLLIRRWTIISQAYTLLMFPQKWQYCWWPFGMYSGCNTFYLLWVANG